jgi:hypothetical protein
MISGGKSKKLEEKHSVGRMQSFGMLKQVVHIVATGLYRVNPKRLTYSVTVKRLIPY